MFPIHLKLKNFLSYREEVSLDFSTIRIACLSGDNGSGKSALLDAITWAIWGKSRASSDRDVVSLGESEMEVTYAFALGSREYRVFRRRSFAGAGRHTLEFYIRESGKTEWMAISGDSVRHTQEKIVRTLNMEYDTFVNSAFILQGRADTFTQKPPGERKKILGDILNLQEYDDLAKLAREDERGLRDRLSNVRQRMAVLDERLLQRARVVDELEVTSLQLTEIGQRLDIAQQLAQSLALQLNQHQKIQQLVESARERRDKEHASLRSLAAMLSKEQTERDRLAALVAGAEEIERGYCELQRCRAEAMRLSQVLQQVQQHDTLRNGAERQIDAERSTLQRERDRHTNAHASASERLRQLDNEKQRLTQLRAEADAAGDTASRLVTIRASIEEQREGRSKHKAENVHLREQMAEIQANLDRIATDEADCPVCLRPLRDHDREHVEATWKLQGKGLGDRYRGNKAQMKELEQATAVLEADLQHAEVADRENAARLGAIRQIEAQLAQRADVQSALDAAQVEVGRIEKVLASDDFAHAARLQVADALADLRALAYDPNAHDNAVRMEREHAPYDERKRDLDQARTRFEGVAASIASILAQQQERQQAAGEAERDVAELEAQLIVAPDLRQHWQDASDECERLETEKSALWSQQGALEGRIAELDRLQFERDNLDKDAVTLALDHGAVRELVEAFGRNGIQAMIVENILPELEDEANRLLRQMSTGQLNVSFRSQRQALSSDNIIETLDIIIRDEYGERPYSLYSGGEAFRINFAVRVALSRLLARRAGANVDMLVIDEGFGTQDSHGRDGLIEALRSVEADFRTILVITHIGEIRELFPTRIDVVKTDRGSQVCVN